MHKRTTRCKKANQHSVQVKVETRKNIDIALEMFGAVLKLDQFSSVKHHPKLEKS